MLSPKELRIAGRGEERLDADVDLLRQFAEAARQRQKTMVGFPVNLDFDFRPLVDFLSLHLNNVGDPHRTSEYGIDSKPFERAVVEFFADLAGARDGEVLGHIAHGGTEANLFAAYLGRERYPDAVLYSSAEAHYSAPKIAQVLRMPHAVVDVDEEGALDLGALEREVRRRGTPAVVIATVGTTSRGAIDDIPGVRRAASEGGAPGVFIHSDAAFGGPLAALGTPSRPWAFADGADSVSVSGHKIIGSPLPSSVVLARAEHVAAIRRPDVAVGSDDDTISGSRDALSPLLLWYALRRLGRDGLARRAAHCLEMAEYAAECLKAAGQHPTRVPGSNIVLFDLPPDEVMRRWHLLEHDGKAHLVLMPHVTRPHVDRLCADLI